MKKIMNKQNVLVVSFRSLLSACCVLVLALSVAPASANEAEESWDEWQAIGKGYVARRKIPPNFNKPASERKSADVADRNVKSAGLVSQGESFGQFYRSTQAVAADTIDSVWIKTQGEGVFSVSIAELVSLTGRTETEIVRMATRRRLTITNSDEAVRWMYYPDTESIIFVGEKYQTFYTDQNAYNLTFGRTSNSKRISISRSTNGPDDGDSTPFLDALKFEEEPDMSFATWAVAGEPDADFWYWQALFHGYAAYESIDVDLFIPTPSPTGTAQIRITLRGWTDIHDGDEHSVSADFNGQDTFSSVTWDGFTEAVLVVDIDQSLLNADGNNVLTLRNADVVGSNTGQFLDQIEIDYERLPVAENGSLWLHDVAKGDQLVTGFSTDQILVIRNPDTTPVARRDITIFEEVDGSFSVAFDANIDNQDYLVVEVAAMEAIVSLDEDLESSLAQSNNSADYLIIASRSFSGTVEALTDYREVKDSLNVRVAWVDDIYDEFSGGRVDPFAISKFLDYVNNSWVQPPSMVTIVGKGTIDHKDRMGYGDSFVPVVMSDTPFGITASDDRLLAGDDVAHFAIGRIPAISDSEGMAYVQKMQDYDTLSAPSEFKAILIADDPDEAGDFHENSDLLADRLSTEFSFDDVEKKYHPSSSTISAEMKSSATWEVDLVNYDGHGSIEQVGSGTGENFIVASDAALLTNTENLPVFASLTCAAGDFSMPGVRSLAGALVMNPNGGAIASYSPTGLSLDQDAIIIGNAFYDSLYGANSRIGDAVLDAKTSTAGTAQLFMRRMYSVVGDPALQPR